MTDHITDTAPDAAAPDDGTVLDGTPEVVVETTEHPEPLPQDFAEFGVRQDIVDSLAAEGIVTALIVTIGIALIGQLEGHVLQPLIMGKQVALHPLVIGIGVTAGTVLAGILGAVIAVPLMAVAWTVFSTLRGDRPFPPHVDPHGAEPAVDDVPDGPGADDGGADEPSGEQGAGQKA